MRGVASRSTPHERTTRAARARGARAGCGARLAARRAPVAPGDPHDRCARAGDRAAGAAGERAAAVAALHRRRAAALRRGGAHGAIAQARARRRASWRVLLEHLDNDADALAALLARRCSARRDQWLRARRRRRRPAARGARGDAACGDRRRARARRDVALPRGRRWRRLRRRRRRWRAPPGRRRCGAARRARGVRGAGRAAAARRRAPRRVARDRRLAADEGRQGRCARPTWLAGFPAIGKKGPRADRSVAPTRGSDGAGSSRSPRAPGVADALGTSARLPRRRYADDEWARIDARALDAARVAASLLARVRATPARSTSRKATLAALDGARATAMRRPTCCCGSTSRSITCWSTSSRTRRSRSSS